MKSLFQSEKVQQFLRFGLVGVIATVLHYLIYLGLTLSVDLSYNVAYTIGYGISFIFNYFATTMFTFKVDVNVSNGMRLALAHISNYFIHLILLNVFINIGIPSTLAPIIVLPIAVLINFFVVRLLMVVKPQKK